ncbi:hypothetical protein S7335_1284 [Synechococcus sp. PCC 7335]|uniref:hypothetical protein n=1 Tax=Synechococcus sp. (strain ATCC 29403 / PCC 7335) TaxID=91464 RepID=UPI00017EE84A|nr:hypothetical protein [Synechococcus sp. PCC 7335]EDX82580.1 hypothetical protein S7335_1284 [Synechococcus sp. PCC 7335]
MISINQQPTKADNNSIVPFNTSALLQEMQTEVPILLPSEVTGVNSSIEEVVTGFLESDADKRYLVSFDYGESCLGASYCNFGSVSGEYITDKTLNPVENLDILFPQPLPDNVPQSTDRPGTVLLTDNIPGFFIPWTTAASCTEARMYWRIDSYQYYVGLECGSLEAVTALANSTIANTSIQADRDLSSK